MFPQVRALSTDVREPLTSEVEGGRVPSFVQAEPTTSGQPDGDQPTPPLVADLALDVDAAPRQVGDRRLDVVAHEVQLRRPRSLGRMHRDLGRWQLEDQPPATGVDRG